MDGSARGYAPSIPGRHIGTVWVSVASSPDARRLNATRDGIRVHAWSAAELSMAVAVPMVLSFPGGGQLFLLFTPFYFMPLAFLGAEMAVSRQAKRSGHRQLPPGGAPRPGRPPRRSRGHAAGSMSTFRPLRFAALPNAAPALASPNLSVTSGARLKLPAATRPIARP